MSVLKTVHKGLSCTRCPSTDFCKPWLVFPVLWHPSFTLIPCALFLLSLGPCSLGLLLCKRRKVRCREDKGVVQNCSAAPGIEPWLVSAAGWRAPLTCTSRGATCLLQEKTQAVGVLLCRHLQVPASLHQPWPREAQRMSVLGVGSRTSLCWIWPCSSHLGLNDSLPWRSLSVLMSVYIWHDSASSESTSITDAHYRPVGFLPLSP